MSDVVRTELIVSAVVRGFEKVSADFRKVGAAVDRTADAVHKGASEMIDQVSAAGKLAAENLKVADASNQGERQAHRLAGAMNKLETQTRQATAASNAAAVAAGKTAAANIAAGIGAKIGATGLGAYAVSALTAAGATNALWAAMGPIGVAIAILSAALGVATVAFHKMNEASQKNATPEQAARLHAISNALRGLESVTVGTGQAMETLVDVFSKIQLGAAGVITVVSVAIVRMQELSGQISHAAAEQKIAALWAGLHAGEMDKAADAANKYQDAMGKVINRAQAYNEARKGSLIGAQQTQNSGGIVTNSQAVTMSAAAGPGGLPGNYTQNNFGGLTVQIQGGTFTANQGDAAKLAQQLGPHLVTYLRNAGISLPGAGNTRK